MSTNCFLEWGEGSVEGREGAELGRGRAAWEEDQAHKGKGMATVSIPKFWILSQAVEADTALLSSAPGSIVAAYPIDPLGPSGLYIR